MTNSTPLDTLIRELTKAHPLPKSRVRELVEEYGRQERISELETLWDERNISNWATSDAKIVNKLVQRVVELKDTKSKEGKT